MSQCMLILLTSQLVNYIFFKVILGHIPKLCFQSEKDLVSSERKPKIYSYLLNICYKINSLKVLICDTHTHKVNFKMCMGVYCKNET